MQDHPVFYKFNSYIGDDEFCLSHLCTDAEEKFLLVNTVMHILSILLHFLRGQRSFWELVEPLADGGRTGYRSSSAGVQ